MKKFFFDLGIGEVRDAICKANMPGVLSVKDEVFIPEADILLCEFRGKRVNIKVDLDYGGSIEPLDPLSEAELAEIFQIISGKLA